MHNCIKHDIRLSNTTIISCTCTVADKKDMFILGIISACMRNGPTTECSRRKVQADRQKCRSTYYFMSRFVCAKAFVRLVGISPDKLYALAKHYKTNGPMPRQLRAGGRKNNTASLALVDTERVVHFIKQYAEDHAVSLPGRVPGFKRDDTRLLPSSCPKSQVYHLYEASANAAGHRVVAASTFKKLWLELCPFIVVARPVTDLCWRCQQNNTNIYRSANLTLEERVSCFKNMQLIWAKLMLNDSSTSDRLKRARSVCVAMDWWRCSQHQPIRRTLRCTTPLTSPSRCIIQAMQLNQGRCTSWQLRSVRSLAFAVKGFQSRWITLLMSVSTAARAPMVSSATSTTFLKALALERRPSICTATTVLGRTRTDMFYGISCGVWWGVFTPRWPWTSCQLVTQSLPRTGVLDRSSNVSDERKSPAWTTSVMLSLRAPQLPRSTFHSLLGGKMELCMSTPTTGRPTLHQSSNLYRASRRLRISDSQLIIPERFSTRPTWRKKRAFWRAETHLESLVPCRTSYLPLDCPENDSSTYSARSGNSFGRTRGMWCAPTQATNLQPEWQHSSGQFAWPVNLLIVLNFFCFVFVSLSLLCSQLLLCCTLYSFVMF